MRQAGIIAAAALYALDNHVDRLSEDHAHARILADAFDRHRGFRPGIGPGRDQPGLGRGRPAVGTAAEVATYLRSRGILVSVLGAQVLRACTHLDVTPRASRVCRRSVIRGIEPALISAMTLVY